MRRSGGGGGTAAAMASLSDTWQNLVSRNYSSRVYLYISAINELYFLIWLIDARWQGVIFFRSVAFTSNRISMSIRVFFGNKFRPSLCPFGIEPRAHIDHDSQKKRANNERRRGVSWRVGLRTCPVPLAESAHSLFVRQLIDLGRCLQTCVNDSSVIALQARYSVCVPQHSHLT